MQPYKFTKGQKVVWSDGQQLHYYIETQFQDSGVNLYELRNEAGNLCGGRVREDDLTDYVEPAPIPFFFDNSFEADLPDYESPTPPFFPQPKLHDCSGMLLEKHLQLAIRAHNGTSQRPEIRGAQYIKEYSEGLAEDLVKVEKFGGDVAAYREKFERLFVAWMRAKSNCLSTMIAGPSNFPVRRAEKSNRSEEKRRKELHEWSEKALRAMERAFTKANTVAVDPVEQIKSEIEQEQADIDRMKEVNKVIRLKKITPEQKAEKLGITLDAFLKLCEPDFMGRVGFPAYKLTNANARLRSKKERLAELTKRAAGDANETTVNGVKVVKNVPENRLQAFFDGKPADDVRAKLKSCGFKWAPSNGCWQNYLNDRSIRNLNEILKNL